MKRIFIQTSKHTATQQRMMCALRAGAYNLDKSEPESLDLPEVCAFSQMGLLPNTLTCCETIIVVTDERFGTIPVCLNHRELVKKVVWENGILPKEKLMVIEPTPTESEWLHLMME